MRWLEPCFIAFSTYSRLWTPRAAWTPENLRLSLCALPLVGAPLGGLFMLWALLAARLGFGAALFSAFAAALPLLYSGGIHMDGYCDTVDALASHQPRARKLEILKDPHLGAFAAIFCGVWLLLCFGLYCELWQWAEGRLFPALGAGFVLSRSLTLFTAAALPCARPEGMLGSFAQTMPRGLAFGCAAGFGLSAAAGMLFLAPLPALCMLGLCLGWALLYRRLALGEFGGVTGDTSGFFLTLCELLLPFGALCGLVLERFL